MRRSIVRRRDTGLLGATASAQDPDKGKTQFGPMTRLPLDRSGQDGRGPDPPRPIQDTAGTLDKYAYSQNMRTAGVKGLSERP